VELFSFWAGSLAARGPAIHPGFRPVEMTIQKVLWVRK